MQNLYQMLFRFLSLMSNYLNRNNSYPQPPIVQIGVPAPPSQPPVFQIGVPAPSTVQIGVPAPPNTYGPQPKPPIVQIGVPAPSTVQIGVPAPTSYPYSYGNSQSPIVQIGIPASGMRLNTPASADIPCDENIWTRSFIPSAPPL